MAAAAASKTVVLESFYLNHRFPKYGIAFRNGRCLVSADQLVELKGKKEYGRDFAELGKLRVRRPQPVLVTRGSTTTGPEEGFATQSGRMDEPSGKE